MKKINLTNQLNFTRKANKCTLIKSVAYSNCTVINCGIANQTTRPSAPISKHTVLVLLFPFLKDICAPTYGTVQHQFPNRSNISDWH